MSKTTFSFDGFSIVHCSEFDNIVKEFLLYPPANTCRDKIEKYVGTTIIPFVISANLWKRIISIYRRRAVYFSNGFYTGRMNKVFINLSRIPSLRASDNCNHVPVNQIPTGIKKSASSLIVHELVHYVFANRTPRAVTLTAKETKEFYTTFWTGIVHDAILDYLVPANTSIALLYEKTNIDSEASSRNRQLSRRFFAILDNLARNHGHLILNMDKFVECTLNMLYLSQGELPITKTTEENYISAYTKVFGDYSRSTFYGQELISVSEIFAIASEFNTFKSKNVTKSLMNLLT